MTPEERFLVEELEPDEKDRRGWGLRDTVTGQLVTAGGETDRYGTPDQARMHRQSHWYHAQRAERHRAVEDHIEQFATDAAHRRSGALGVPSSQMQDAAWAAALSHGDAAAASSPFQAPGQPWYAVARPEASSD